MRLMVGVAVIFLGFSGLVMAEGTPTATPPPAAVVTVPPVVDAPWQAVVTGQIEAFRKGDGAAALKFAGVGFRSNYTDPDKFFADILSGGYEPIVKSRSHTFGNFDKVSDTLVMQVVKLVGPDQGLFEALYQMGLEDDGWHVLGVALRPSKGVGI